MTQEQLDAAWKMIQAARDEDDQFEDFAAMLEKEGGFSFHRDQEFADLFPVFDKIGFQILEHPLFGEEGWVIVPKESK